MKKFLVFTAIFILAAMSIPPAPAQADRLTVVASIFPLYDFARKVAGNEADVDLLLPPGASPHTWEPRPSEIVRISRADLFLYVSQEMEPWVGNLLRAVGGSDLHGMELLKTREIRGAGSQDPRGLEEGSEADHGHPADPHFWLDFSLAASAVKAMGSKMADLDPPHAAGFMARSEEYSRKLIALDRQYAAGLANCRSRTFVTGGHSAFGYLAKRYGLVQVPLYGMSPDSEPTPAYLASVVQKMKEEGLDVVFLEEMASPRLASVLASEVGAATLVLAPGGNIPARRKTEETSFIRIMEQNLATLREGLSCE